MRVGPLLPAPFGALAAFAVASAACTSAREKDCRELMPLVERARTARTLTLTDGGMPPPNAATEPHTAAAALRAPSLRDEALVEPRRSLADALEGHAVGLAALEETAMRLRMKPLAPDETIRLDVDALKPHVEAVLTRCGLPGLRTTAQAEWRDCAALDEALAVCAKPAADDTTVHDQLVTCASAIEKVKADDARLGSALREIVGALRGLEPLARHVGAPAKEAIAVVGTLGPNVAKVVTAREDADRAEAALRALCKK